MMRISLALLTILCFTFSLYAQQTTNLEIDKNQAQIYLGLNGDGGPHGIVFDDPDGNLLNFFYRANPNSLQIENALTDEPLFSINHDTEYGYFAGRLGVGISSPSYWLHVNSEGANNVGMFESTDDYAILHIKDLNTTDSEFIRRLGDRTFLYSGGISHLTLDNGFVGIGINSPSEALEVSGNIKVGFDSKLITQSIEGTRGFLNLNNDNWTVGATSISSRGKLSLALDNNNNDSNSELVIGTDGYDPTDPNWTNIMVIKDGGNIGIGEDIPTEKVHIKNGNLLLENGAATIAHGWSSPSLTFDDTENEKKFTLNFHRANEKLQFKHSDLSTPYMEMKSTGQVIIDAESGNYDLIVKGAIGTEEVAVEVSPGTGPDYVFEEDYPLASLEEIKAYITVNKHLPEVPSAKEMETNGINLSEMNMLLLKKVEELTLHQIELMEKYNSQQRLINDQSQIISQLKEELTLVKKNLK